MSKPKLIPAAANKLRFTPKAANLEHLIQLGLLLLVALMPFHAFFSVWLGSLTGHEAVIQAWKEVLLILLSVATAVLIWLDPARLRRLRQPWILAGGAFAILAVIVTLADHPSLKAAGFGAKTDLEFLLAAVLASVVANKQFVRRLIPTVLIGAAIVILFGLLEIFVLPSNFLTHFGYGPTTILPVLNVAPESTALRFESTLGGPNQLGTYLILPVCLSLALAIRRRHLPLGLLSLGGVIVLISSYSRSAWLGAALGVAITLGSFAPAKWRRTIGISLVAISALLAAILSLAIARVRSLQYYLLHAPLEYHGRIGTSNAGHVSTVVQGYRSILASPLGHGLGTAGPTAFHTGTGSIIENYYLQIGYETGVAGMLVFIGLIGALLVKLVTATRDNELALPAAAAIIGVSLAALFLPTWTDSSTALIVFICAGAAASCPKETLNV